MDKILLLSDIHSNLEAMRSVLRDADSRYGEFDAVCVLGDFVGYGANPNEVTDALFEIPNCHIVKGNHEAAAVGDFSTRDFNPTAARAAEWTARELTPANAARIRKLPYIVRLGDLTLCHGSPSDPVWEYMRTPQQWLSNLDHFDTPGCAYGHTHVPCFIGIRDGAVEGGLAQHGDACSTSSFSRWYINPGSVGQPRDSDPSASYAVIRANGSAGERGRSDYRVAFRRVEYDVETTQGKILQAGLPPDLAYRLSVGM